MEKKTIKSQVLYFILSFFLPCLIFICILYVRGFAPFGGTSNLVSDLYYQYIDFFAWLRNSLTEGKNLSYSFSISLGNPTISLYAYYLASPINFFVVLFPQEYLPYCILLITGIKIGLSGLTMYIFSRSRFPEIDRIYSLCAALGYALMYYNISLATDLMWLDGVYMLPVMLLGAYKLLSENKPVLMIVSITVSILFNWYTAYMNCLFLFIYFVYELSLCGHKLANNVRYLLWFALSAITGVLISSFFFLPVIFEMMQGKASPGGGLLEIFEPSPNENILNLLKGCFLGIPYEDTTRQFSSFCGTCFLAMMIFYFTNKNVEWKEKRNSLILLLIMIASVYIKTFESIWNGLRKVDAFYCRFGYIAAFTVLFLGLKGLSIYLRASDDIQIKKRISIIIGILILFFSFFDFIEPVGIIKYGLILYILIAYILWGLISHIRIGGFVLCGILCVELLVNGFYVYREGYNSKDAYIDYVKAANEQIELIRNYDREGFYRIDENMNRQMSKNGIAAAYNDSMAYGYSGISNYASTTSAGTVKFASDCGYYDGGHFIIPYSEPILPADSMLGVKYIMSFRDIPGWTKVEELSRGLNGKDVYINEYALPLGFKVSEDVTEGLDNSNPFLFQNELFSKALGYTCDIFKPMPNEKIKDGNNIIIKTGIQNDRKNIIYSYFNSNSSDMPVYIDDTYRTNYNAWLSYQVMCVGYSDTEHLLRVEKVSENAENFGAQIYYLDMDVFRKAISDLSGSRFETEIFKDGYVEGNYISNGDERLLLTIPYNKGWKISVNGENTDFQKGMNNFITFPVEKGENHIVLSYNVYGFGAGTAISFAGIVLLFANKQIMKKIFKGKNY